MTKLSPHTASRPRVPAAVWTLGIVSLLMDTSSELIHSLLPVFMVTVLGTSVLAVGLIEGAAEATALIVKVFSGVISDWFGRRKPLAVLGYGLAAASKPLFAIATSTGHVLTARLADRLGKGIRGAPRDALIADITPRESQGAAFGLRQALDTVGAFLGPLLAMAFMLLWADNFRAVFWVAVIPAVLSVSLLAFGIREPEVPRKRHAGNPIRRENLQRMGAAFWWVVGVGGVFTLARFSEAFLILRAQQGGLAVALVPLVLITMNVVYAAGAYPFGKLADRTNRLALLAWGLAVLIASDILLAIAGSGPLLWTGIALWGLHMAMTQGLLSAMVAACAPADLRGTAFGVFNLASGIAMLAASAIAGFLWDFHGPAFTFGCGAILTALALAVLLVRRPAMS
jgi:MFS family permease